jgi:WD40 repeat protein
LWPQALEEGLKAVKAVAVFMGRELGGWQKREMWFALDRQVREDKQGRAFPVIPVLLEGADLTPGFLFANTWIDLRSGLDNVVAAEALNAFERAIKSNGPAPIREGLAEQAAERAATICPYRGLKIFREEDAAFFAGRTAFADQLLDFTRERDLVAVVGPSGSGKSSVVQAGLLPRLRREHPPADTWDAVSFTPGREPFHRLASALIPLLEPHKDEVSRLAMAQELGDNLAVDRTKVETVIRRVIDKSNGTLRLLLVADQFEELFTLATESGRRPFVRALLSALGNAPFTLLVTLRADFYGHIITLDRELSDRLASSQLNIGALTQDELRESITATAELVGLRFEPGLVERILTDVGSEPGHLPLVEFALTELWHRREGNRLANRAYDEIGGVTGALAQRAESEFKRFTPEEQGVARRLFSRLVRVARPEEAGEDTRQRTDLSDADTSAKRVANKLADSRLLVTGSEASKGIFSVELAHEALIRNWARLRGWLNEDREFLLWRQRLQVHLGEWQEHRYAAGYLLRGAPLSEAERWLLGRPQDLSDAEQQLTRESIALRQREREAEEQRRQAEIENAKRLKEAAEVRAEAEQELARKAKLLAEERARQAKKFRLLAAGLGTLLLLTLGIATFAFWERAVARGRELVAVSRSAENADSDLSVLVAAQSVAATWRWGSTVLPEAEQQLHHSILTSHMTLSGHRGGVSSVVWSSDGKRLATASDDRTAKVWDADTGKELLTLTGHRNIVMSVAWSPAETEEGQRLATGSGDGTAKVWDAENGKELLTLTGHSNTVSSVAWSPDGKRLATGSWDRTAKVWDASNGKELLTLTGHRDSVLSMTWSPDGERLATGSSDGTAKVWDAETGKELLTLTSHRGSVVSVAWSPDAKRLATGSDDQTAKVWDVDTGKELLTLTGHSTYVDSVAWSADGKRLATGSSDDTAKVWDAGNGKELLTLTGDSSSVDSVAWSSDGKRLATASWDHTAKVWDAGSGKELLTLTGHGDYVWSAAWSPAPDGKGERQGIADLDRQRCFERGLEPGWKASRYSQ